MANRYDAFISYSTAADADLAPSLQTGLQRLGKPWSKRRALEVFRDATGLAVTPDLWGSITDALDSSRWFILLASPEATESRWVNQEIERWMANDADGAARILPILTEGTMDWDDDAGDWSADSDAVPDTLRGLYDSEPRYIDLRWADDTTRASGVLTLDHPQFRQAVAEIAAPIHGLGQDDLIGEDVRQHRLATRLRRIAVTALVLLTTGALIATVLAVLNQRAADQNAAEALSRQYAATATTLIDGDAELAALYAVEAFLGGDADASEARTPDADRSLRNALNQLLHADTTLIGPTIDVRAEAIAISPDGTTLATVDENGAVATWDTSTGEPRWAAAAMTTPVAAPPSSFSSPARVLDFHPDGQSLLLTSERDTGGTSSPVFIIDAERGLVDELDATGPAAWLPDGSLVAVRNENTVARWDDVAAEPSLIAAVDEAPVSALAVSASGSLLVVDGGERVRVVENPATTTGVTSDAPVAFSIPRRIDGGPSFSVWATNPADEQLLVFSQSRVENDGMLRPVFSLTTIDLVDPASDPLVTDTAPVADGGLSISPDGVFAAIVDGEREQGLPGSQSVVLQQGRFVELRQLATDTWGIDSIRIPANEAADAAWMPDGRVLAIASRRGIQFHRVDASPDVRPAHDIAVSPTGDLIATWDAFSGRITIENPSEPGSVVRVQAAALEGEFDVSNVPRASMGLVDGGDVLLLAAPVAEGALAAIRTSDGSRTDLPETFSIIGPFTESPSGQRLVGGDGRIVELSDGALVRTLELDPDVRVTDLRWTEAGDEIVVLADDGTLAVHAGSGAVDVIDSPIRRPQSLDANADATAIALGDDRGRVQLVGRNGDGVPVSDAHRSDVRSVDISPGGGSIASAGGAVLIHRVDPDEPEQWRETWSSDDVPALASFDWNVVEHLSDDTVLAASEERVAVIVGADVDLACTSVDARAFARFEQALGQPSICLERLGT